MSTGRNGLIVLCDQGGERMDVMDDMTTTLRAEARHPPIVMENAEVLESAGFCTEHSEHSRSIGYEEEVSPTLRAGVVPAAIALENHPTDSRVKICDDGVVPTLTGRMGTGGNNVPLTMIPFVKGTRPHSAEEAPDWKEGETANTLNTFDLGEGCCNELVVKAYGICSKDSNSMKSDNPHSGFYEAKTARTLDGNGGNPCCNQGGIAVVAFTDKAATLSAMDGPKGPSSQQLGNPEDNFVCEPVCVDQGGGKSNCTVDEGISPPLACTHGGSPAVAFAQNQRNEVRDLGNKAGAIAAEPGIHQQTYVIQGSMIGRDNKNGPQGDGVNEDVSFTLNTVDRHAVAYGIGRDAFNQGQNAQYKPAIEEEVQPTLVAKGPGAVAVPNDVSVSNEKDKTYAMTTGSFTLVEEEISPTLLARDYKDPAVVNDKAYGFFPQMKAEGMSFSEEVSATLVNGTNPGFQNGVVEPEYIVRRLTPTECARLQGFPDWWCHNLGTENPTEEELAFWTKVWETHRRLISHAGKPKTEKQIRKWLKDPYSDAAEYKLWGNGICLNIAYFVLSGIVWAEGLTDSDSATASETV